MLPQSLISLSKILNLLYLHHENQSYKNLFNNHQTSQILNLVFKNKSRLIVVRQKVKIKLKSTNKLLIIR